jgi:hypothetical protein
MVLNGRITDELERIWKGTVLASSRFYLDICLKRLRKTTKDFSQDTQCPS